MDLFEKYYNKALRFLSFRPRSEKEVRENLNKKSRSQRTKTEQVAQQVIDQVIDKLKQQKFLGDEEFAKWWIEQRTKFSPRGLRLIKMELKNKGVDHEIIEKSIYDLRFTINDDLERAKELARRKLSRYKTLNKQDLYQKLGGFLARRGFDWDTIKQSIDEVIREEV